MIGGMLLVEGGALQVFQGVDGFGGAVAGAGAGAASALTWWAGSGPRGTCSDFGP
jgi:hypothetical protein